MAKIVSEFALISLWFIVIYLPSLPRSLISAPIAFVLIAVGLLKYAKALTDASQKYTLIACFIFADIYAEPLGEVILPQPDKYVLITIVHTAFTIFLILHNLAGVQIPILISNDIRSA